MENKKIAVTFYGGTGSVTGANFLLEDLVEGKRLLVDCGLFQGSRFYDAKNSDRFPYDPSQIDYLIVTHAHLDHIGRIPKLIHDGFKGVIYSTAPTKEIAYLSLHDSLRLMQREAEATGRQMSYDERDVEQSMNLWETFDYHQEFTVGRFQVRFADAGHILGSVMVEIRHEGKKIVFTGDLGNSPAPLLRDTEELVDATYLVMESVYGDRNHENRDDRRHKLREVIKNTISRGGTLLIPAFSIERTQEILFEIENMVEASEIPLVPVFLDSPLGIKVTSVYKKYKQYLNKDASYINDTGDGVFRFPQLHTTLTTESSKAIRRANPRKIIIAGSGMSTGGRILHHEKAHLSDPKSTLLLMGYQSAGSMGRVIQDGAKMVKIFGEEVAVNAEVVSISGYSAHKDSDHLLEFVQDSAATLKNVFVVMGEPKAALFLVQRIRDYLGLNATAPEEAERVELEL
jgi:metallo-beta-lactamase family protein